MKSVGLIIVLSILTASISACSQVVQPTQNPQYATRTVPEKATESPTEQPVPQSATSTAGQVDTQAENTPTFPPSTLIESSQPAGEVSFQDKLALSDQVIFSLQSLPVLTSQVYQAWLTAEDGSVISAGILTQQPDGSSSLTYTSPDGSSALGKYTHFFITQEDAMQSIPGVDVVVLGEISPELHQTARVLFEINQGEPATPRNKPFVQGMVEQYALALQHIDNAVNAQSIGASAETKQHLEHVVNILEGSQGERFKDYTGDETAQNPGDGFGVVLYIRQVASSLKDPAIETSAAELIDAITGLETRAIAILEDQNGASDLPDLKLQAIELGNDLLKKFYLLIQQAFIIKLTPAP